MKYLELTYPHYSSCKHLFVIKYTLSPTTNCLTSAVMTDTKTNSPNLPVTDHMQLQLDRWQATGDQRCDFLNCYLMMTSNMIAAIEMGEFNDPEWIHRLLHHFANYYFDALDAYERDLQDTPQVWRLTFDSAQQPDALVMQNLLLGINAHINYDLIFTLVDMLSPEWQQLTQDERQGRYDDHCHVNDVIRRTIDSVQDTIIEAEIPQINIFEELLGQTDEWLISKVITHWRDEVWEQAQLLLENPDPPERDNICQNIEAQTLKRAQLIQRLFPGG